MVIADFQMKDKIGKSRFVQKTFLLADTKFEVVLEMSFLKISNVDLAFSKETLTWKSYPTNKALLTTKQVQLVDLKKFVIVALDADSKTFVMHVAIQEREEIVMDSARKTQIETQSRAKSGA